MTRLFYSPLAPFRYVIVLRSFALPFAIGFLCFAPRALAQQQTPTPDSGFFDRDMKGGSLVEGMDFGTRKKVGGESAGTLNRGEREPGRPPAALVPEIAQPNELGAYIPTPRPTPTPAPTPEPPPDPVPTPAPEIPDTSEVPRGAEFYQRLIDQVRQPTPVDDVLPPEPEFPVKSPKREKRYTF